MKRLVIALIALCCCAPMMFAATGTISPSPFLVFLDANGNPVNAGCIWTYMAGLSTPATTYADVNLSTPNGNPIIASSAGRFTAFLVPGSSYKFVYENTPCSSSAHGAVLVTADNISAIPSSSSSLDILGVAGEALTAGQVVYLSDGSGSKTAGQWFKADNANTYSSTSPLVGMVPNNIALAATGTIRLSGSVTGLSGLVVGGTYYVGTAGALTATIPGNARNLGSADTTTSLVLAGNPPPTTTLDNGIDDFRLTLTTGTPVTTSNVTAAGTIYLAPYKGNRITLFDASGNASLYTSAQISIAVPASTTQMYDVFAYASSGAVTLELLAWTNDTTRATAIVNTVAVGVYTKSGDATRRYLGSFRTTGVANQTEDSLTKRYLWNYYNRVPRLLRVTDATGSWTYSTAAYRQANNSAANQVETVIGVAEVGLDLRVLTSATNSTGAVSVRVGIGQGSTTVLATNCFNPDATIPGATGLHFPVIAEFSTLPAVGYQFWVWLENSDATATTTWFGGTVNGLLGWIQG